MQTACRTCRRRRLACDKKKPSCARCTADNRPCGGYTREDQNLFVNFDSSNIRVRRKRVLCDAITARNIQDELREVTVQSYASPSEALCIAKKPDLIGVYALDFSPADFAAHFATLWHYFTTAFTCTPDAWALAYNKLALHSRALDLALIALSVQRFSASRGHEKLFDVACNTYGESVRLVRTLIAGLDEPQSEKRAADLALLAATSLALGLVDGCRHSPVTIFESGWLTVNPHLQGAGIFTQRAGPLAFSTGGLHLVFKKLREMEVLNALCNYRVSFLVDQDWQETPWTSHSKTWRDYLLDIACKINVLVVAGGGLEEWVCKRPVTSQEISMTTPNTLFPRKSSILLHPELQEEQNSTSLETLHRTAGRLISDLKKWYSLWTTQNYPEPLAHANDDKTFLTTEYRALLLLLHLVQLRAATLLSSREDASILEMHCVDLLDSVRTALCHPSYKPEDSERTDLIGITEGQCRSLLPAWTVLVAETMLERGELC